MKKTIESKKFEPTSQTESLQSVILTGNEAAAEGALAAGCDFYAGYPITPSSEIMETLARKLPKRGGVFIQMEDELASFSAVIGASWAGAKAMTATSGPGLSLMMEGIGYAAITETPCVVVDVQRAGPGTGQATRVGSGDILQVRYGSHGDYCPIALSPWSVQEMHDLTIKAFGLAHAYRVPTFIMAEESVGHLRETLVLRREVEPVVRNRDITKPPFGSDLPDGVAPMPVFGDGANLLVTGSTHDEWGFRKVNHPDHHKRLVERINRKVLDHTDELAVMDGRYLEDADVVVLAYGFTGRAALSAVKALRDSGVRVGFLRLVTLWPFPAKAIFELGKNVEKIVVPEMNLGQVAGLVRQNVSCEVISLSQVDGEVIVPATIEKKTREAIA